MGRSWLAIEAYIVLEGFGLKLLVIKEIEIVTEFGRVSPTISISMPTNSTP